MLRGSSRVNLQIVVSKLWDREHVVEGAGVDGEECDGLVRREGTEGLSGRVADAALEAECPCETEAAFGKKMVGWSERPVL